MFIVLRPSLNDPEYPEIINPQPSYPAQRKRLKITPPCLKKYPPL